MADYKYYNFSGGLDKDSSKIDISQSPKKLFWTDSKNVEIYKNTGIARMNGNAKVFERSDAILGLFEYKKGDESILVGNDASGAFFILDGETFIEKKTGLDTSAKCNYVNFLDGVIVTNGVDDPFYFVEGAETEVQQCNAPATGLPIAVYQGRIWLASGGTLYYSSLGKFNVWTSNEELEDGGSISNFHNDSSQIIGLSNYKGYLAIHKENQTYLLTGSDPETFAIVPFSNKGSVSPFGITTIENKQFFYNEGIYTLEQVGELNQIRLSSEVSDLIHSEFANIDTSRLNEIISIPYYKKRQVWFYIPFPDVSGFKKIFIYDIDNKAWLKREVPQEIISACLFDNSIFSGTADGEILIEDMGYTFDGQEIEWFWESPYHHFGEPVRRRTKGMSENKYTFGEYR